MRTLNLLLVGIVVGWAASGVGWSREAVGQDSAAPTADAERSIRRERGGALRRRGLLPPRETAAPTRATDAPPYDPNSNGEPKPYVPPGVDSQQGSSFGMEELGEPIAEPTRATVSSPSLLGRYQVSAYGSPSGHGCYVVDTMTGQTWHVANGQPPQVVASGLTPYAPQPAAPTPSPMLTPPPILSAPNTPSAVPRPTPDAAD